MSPTDDQPPGVTTHAPDPPEADAYRRLLLGMEDGFAVLDFRLDAQGRPGGWRCFERNAAFAALTGAPEAEPFAPPPLLAGHLAGFAEAARSGTPHDALHHDRAAGRWLALRACRLGSAPTRVAVIVRDATAARATADALDESRACLRQIADAVPQIVWIADPDGRPQFFNRRWHDYTGLDPAADTPPDPAPDTPPATATPDPAPATAAHALVHPDDLGTTLERFEAARAAGTVFEVEHRLRGRDGGYRWFLVRGEPQRAPATGEIARWMGASTDIHDRKLAEAALAASEQQLRLIVGNTRDHAIFLTGPDDIITDWWPGAEAIFGWSAAEAVGQPAALIYTEEDRTAGVLELELGTAEREGSAPDIRWHLRKDGRRVFIEGMVSALRGPDGRLHGFIKIGQDMTARRAAEEARRRSEARFRQFGDAASDLLWIADAATLSFDYASPAASRILGLDPGGLGPAAVAALVHPGDRDGLDAHLGRIRERGQDEFAFRIRRAGDHAPRWLRNTGFALGDESGPVLRIAGITKDVTEQEETRERLKILVSELQHRTRNLLAVVQALAERTLRRSSSLADFRERFYPRLGALARVNELLSRLEDDARVTFDQLVRAELAAHGAFEDGEAGRVDLDGPGGVRLRSSQIQTVALALHELSTNALKHGALTQPEGRLSLRWQERHGPDGEGSLVFTWKETGLAIEAAAADARRGFGRELIEQALPRQLSTSVDYRLEPDGVRCTVTLPISTRPDP